MTKKYLLAFYKGDGTFYDKCIRWWTGSIYSHVELCLTKNEKTFEAFGSSPRDGGVRYKTISIKESHWDFIEVSNLDISKIEKLDGKKYDWFGIIFSQIFPFSLSMKDRFFCSEMIAIALNLEKPQNYSPQSIFAYIRKRN